MGIYVKQWTIAQFVYRDDKCVGVERVKGLPLMTRGEAETALSQAKGNFCIINTLSE